MSPLASSVAAPEAMKDLPQGWFHHGRKILELLETHKPKVCVELGSWRGASAIAMARVVRQWKGTVTCVDTWTGDAFSGGVTESRVRPPNMVGEIVTNIVEADVAASIRLVVAPTVEAAKWWNEPIDFLYIDADHSYAACLADLEAWVPHVRPGGLIAGDDYGNPTFPGTRMAWNYFELERGLSLQRASSPGTHPEMQLIYGTV